MSLPDEVLREIFIYCTALDANEDGLNVHDKKLAPVLLSQICSAWRETALQSPELWNRLSLVWTTRKRWSPTLLGELWFSRCKNAPMWLSIHEHQDGYHPKNQGVHFAFRYADRLVALYIRHEKLESHFPRYINVGPDAVSASPDLQLPVLKRLELRGFSVNHFAPLVNKAHFPGLTHYVLHPNERQPPYPESYYNDLPNCLTHLDIHTNIIIEERLFVISQILFPSLSSLSIKFRLRTTIARLAPKTELLPMLNLRHLKIEFTSGSTSFFDGYDESLLDEGDVTLVFRRLYTPKLKTLVVSHEPNRTWSTDYYVTERIRDLLVRSECSLEELSIPHWPEDNELGGGVSGLDVMQLATTIPTLRKLSFNSVLENNCWGDYDGKHPLIQREGAEWKYLPLLEELNCSFNADSESATRSFGTLHARTVKVDQRAISESICALAERMRSSSPYRLKHCQAIVYTHLEEGLTKHTQETLKSLVPLGLEYITESLWYDPCFYNEGGCEWGGYSPPRRDTISYVSEVKWTTYPGFVNEYVGFWNYDWEEYAGW